MSHDIVIRFSDDEAAALQKRKDDTLVPMSAFIRRAVRKALGEPVVDADSEPECEPESIQLPAEIAAKVEALKAKQIQAPVPEHKTAPVPESKASHATAARSRMNAGAVNSVLIVTDNPARLLEKGGE